MANTHEIMKLRVFGNYLFTSLLLKNNKKKEDSIEFLFHFSIILKLPNFMFRGKLLLYFEGKVLQFLIHFQYC